MRFGERQNLLLGEREKVGGETKASERQTDIYGKIEFEVQWYFRQAAGGQSLLLGVAPPLVAWGPASAECLGI